MRRSTPRWRTCRLSWPTWCDSSDSPARGRPKSAFCVRATWIAAARSGCSRRRVTRRNTTASAGPFASVPTGRKSCCGILARDAESYCFRPCDSEAKRLAAANAARVTPLSCGNRPGSNRKRRPKRSPGDRYEVDSYRRAIHRACDRRSAPDVAEIRRSSPHGRAPLVAQSAAAFGGNGIRQAVWRRGRAARARPRQNGHDRNLCGAERRDGRSRGVGNWVESQSSGAGRSPRIGRLAVVRNTFHGSRSVDRQRKVLRDESGFWSTCLSGR